jgi:hypothetical protein
VTSEIPEFLDLEDVLELHTLQLARYGGADGVRDRGLLESALAQWQATFDGEFVHPDLFAMAAAYCSTSYGTTPSSTATSAPGCWPRWSSWTSTESQSLAAHLDSTSLRLGSPRDA